MTPLVMLPGMMCDARLFASQIAEFSRGRAVMVAPLSRFDRVEALARDVLAHAPPRFALAGLSMGGIVAMEMLAQAPERIERLAVLDTNPLAETDKVKARRAPQMKKVAAGQLAAVMRDEMKPNYLANGPRREGILDLCMQMALDLGADVFQRQSLALMHRPDQCATLQRAEVPALVLCGADDSLCPIARHEKMHGLLANSTLSVIEGAGHLPTLEQPEATNRALRLWLER